MRIRLRREHIVNGVTIPAGRVIDLPGDCVRPLVLMGIASPLEDPRPVMLAETPPTAISPEITEAGGNTDDDTTNP